MTQPNSPGFSADGWEQLWAGTAHADSQPPHPYLAAELGGIATGTAIEAGCGTGAEAVWLAEHGWQVTGADVSPSALTRAAARSVDAGVPVEWIEADLTTWEPAAPVDLVTTFYAHPDGDQVEFYRRLAGWVEVGGTLLVVGHLHHAAHAAHAAHADDHSEPPEETTATAERITGLLAAPRWRIETASEGSRTVPMADGARVLHDVVVRATRLA